MTPNQIIHAVRSEFRDRIDLVQTSITNRVQYENVDFTPPESGMWASFHVLLGERTQVELGKQRTFRTPGVMYASLFDEPNVGTKNLGEVADAIVGAFQGVTCNGILFYVPSVDHIGKLDNEPYYQVVVRSPFHYDEFITL